MQGLSTIQAGNGSAISNPDSDRWEDMSAAIVCRDPDNPEQPCPICDGRGVYLLHLPHSDERFGKFQRCPNHPVAKDRALHERLRRAGNLASQRDKTFATFDIELRGREATRREQESLARAKRSGRAFAAAPSGWIVFAGPHGCGKTHLAAAIANERLERFGERVLFLTAPDLLDFLRISYSSNAQASYDETFERLRRAPLLVLDDLGVENPSVWAREKLFQLLNYRHQAALPTVITTNVHLEELDPRISSRLQEQAVVQHIRISAPDYRRLQLSPASALRITDMTLYQDMRYDSFSTAAPQAEEEQNLKRALKLARQWSAAPKGWLCFLGLAGCGKTHLAAAIANDLWERGRERMFLTVPDLLDTLRLAFDPSSATSFDTRFREIRNSPILILDDLRLASATPWAKEKLIQLIDYRYLSRLPTVITTTETMESSDPRLATRLMDRRLCTPFAIKAPSYTMRTQQKR